MKRTLLCLICLAPQCRITRSDHGIQPIQPKHAFQEALHAPDDEIWYNHQAHMRPDAGNSSASGTDSGGPNILGLGYDTDGEGDQSPEQSKDAVTTATPAAVVEVQAEEQATPAQAEEPLHNKGDRSD